MVPFLMVTFLTTAIWAVFGETTFSSPLSNDIPQELGTNEIDGNRAPTHSIVERVHTLESVIFDYRLEFEQQRDTIKEEVKIMRNATLLLLSLVASGGGSECQGLKDTASKVKILYAALAAYEPSLNYPNFETEREDLLTTSSSFTGGSFPHDPDTGMEEVEGGSPMPPAHPTTEERGSLSPVWEIGLESGDLIWDSSVTNPSSSSGFPAPSSWASITRPFPTDLTSAKTTTQLTDIATKIRVETTQASILCPQGSKLVGAECFSVHLDHMLNWTSARSFCRSLGGDLAEPKLKNDKLPRQLLKTWPAFAQSNYWTLWVGATDLEKEGEWHWVTGGPLHLNESARWEAQENPDIGQTQDCLAMILWVPGRWQRWDLLDDPCDLEWFFFCEYST